VSRRRRLRLIARILRTRVRVGRLLATESLDHCLAALDVPRRDPPDFEPDEIGRVTARLLRNRRHPRTTCLQRALTRFALLRDAGCHPEFLVGIDPSKPHFEGHAWILLDGSPYWEFEPLDCTLTFRYPP
jgi:hypothetical protein